MGCQRRRSLHGRDGELHGVVGSEDRRRLLPALSAFRPQGEGGGLMRQALPRGLLVAVVLVGSGCGVPAVGLAPTAPPLETKLFSQTLGFAVVDSLAPTLRWQALDAELLQTTGEITA